MKKKLMKQIRDSIFEVMETMFFLTLEDAGLHEDTAADLHTAADVKTAAVTFSGSFPGTIFLSVPDGLLAEMTENFMGEDLETLTADHVDGTLKEALNMIAGSALTRMDNTAYMGLGIPEMVPSPGPADDIVALTTGSAILIARLKLD